MIAALFGFAASAIFLAGWFYRSVESAKIILGIWLVAYCLVPVGVDLVRSHWADDEDAPVLALTASFSPIGLLIEDAARRQVDLRPAAIFHAMIPALPIALYLRAGRRKRVGVPVLAAQVPA